MFRIAENMHQYTHKCVNCGVTIQYNKYGTAVCKICKTTQNFFNVDRTTDIPCDFMFGECLWRVWYHLTYTN